MADHPLTLNVPEHLYERLREMAEASALPVEAVAVRQLEATLEDARLTQLPREEQQELSVFKLLTDDTLQGILREQVPDSVQERMQRLMDRNTSGEITLEEYSELSGLVERANRLMLRKAWAADVLMNRGNSITAHDFSTPRE